MNHSKKLYEVQCVRCMKMVKVICNDQAGHSFHMLCSVCDTIKDLKKVIKGQTGIRWDTMILKKASIIFKDHVTPKDYDIHDGMNLDLYYQ